MTSTGQPHMAGFIGNPPMNLFPSRLDEVGGRTVLVVGDQTVTIAGHATAPRRAPVTAGIRPEHVAVVLRGAGTVDATVAHVELLGHETLVYADVAGVRFVVRAAGMSALAPGERVALRLDPSQVHVFASKRTTRTHPASLYLPFPDRDLHGVGEEGVPGRPGQLKAVSLCVRSAPRPLRLCRGVSEARSLHPQAR